MAYKICVQLTENELAYIKDGLLTFLGAVKLKKIAPNYPETEDHVRKVLKDLGAL